MQNYMILNKKRYGVVYIYPPWSYSRNWNNDPKNGGITYPTMKLDDIMKLPIGEIADKNCVLALWITHPKLMWANAIMDAWKFEWKTTLFDWIKTNKDGSIRMGLGHHSRSGSEICLLGMKGSIKRMDNKVMQVQKYPIQGHSAKPIEFKSEILRLYGSHHNNIEIFARSRDPNWDTIGNDISGLDINQELQQIIDGTWKQS